MGCIRLRSGDHMKMNSFRRAQFFELFYRISYSFRISKKSKTPARGQCLCVGNMTSLLDPLTGNFLYFKFYQVAIIPPPTTILDNPCPLLRPRSYLRRTSSYDCCASCIPIQLVSFLITCSPCSISSCTSVSQLSAYPPRSITYTYCACTPQPI